MKKKNGKYVSVKLDFYDYERILAKSKAGDRSIAAQLRVIIRDWFQDILGEKQ